MKHLFLLLVLSLTVISCKKDNPTPPTPVPTPATPQEILINGLWDSQIIEVYEPGQPMVSQPYTGETLDFDISYCTIVQTSQMMPYNLIGTTQLNIDGKIYDLIQLNSSWLVIECDHPYAGVSVAIGTKMRLKYKDI